MSSVLKRNWAPRNARLCSWSFSRCLTKNSWSLLCLTTTVIYCSTLAFNTKKLRKSTSQSIPMQLCTSTVFRCAKHLRVGCSVSQKLLFMPGAVLWKEHIHKQKTTFQNKISRCEIAVKRNELPMKEQYTSMYSFSTQGKASQQVNNPLQT